MMKYINDCKFKILTKVCVCYPCRPSGMDRMPPSFNDRTPPPSSTDSHFSSVGMNASMQWMFGRIDFQTCCPLVTKLRLYHHTLSEFKESCV
ncbi:hypothetical protein AVEN_117583-1 [Araneus ventricosus]|uniref:Uncharacterized protein n=1 Tax=Araneus ventricosus TaxID=182803 RepID=A0A4Y2MXC6_ARAVE|nr:hypothetical protein AVEN_272574-1 [Araneus ventricosus]GBN31238.1 hypothetical protein AVEN_117583-1 [Araneus ventricosus]